MVTRGETPIAKNVIVTDEFGNKLTGTYSKRAKGLIKKGRAEYVGENEIRLKGCSVTPCLEDNMNNTNFTDNKNAISNITIDAETGEVIENAQQTLVFDNYTIHGNEPNTVKVINNTDLYKPKPLFFNAREWLPSKDCNKTAAVRSFISDPFGGLTESYTIGDWNYNWSQIETKDMVLEKNTDYEFLFWLNGGENDRNCEICRFEIIFDNDNENRYTYNLNRTYIKYLKHYKGWYLYGIPFNTGEAGYTKLRFISMSAYTTIIRANTAESYDSLPEDIPPQGLPQRHNIWFAEGFPRNAWWSGKAFPDSQNDGSLQQKTVHTGEADPSALSDLREVIFQAVSARLEGELDPDDIADDIADELMDEIDVDSIRNQIIQKIEGELDSDDIADELMDEIDMDSIRNHIVHKIKESSK